jgi:hypothetical protein
LDNGDVAKGLINLITEDRPDLREQLLRDLDNFQLFLRREVGGHFTNGETPCPWHSYQHAFGEGDSPRSDVMEEQYCSRQKRAASKLSSQ